MTKTVRKVYQHLGVLAFITVSAFAGQLIESPSLSSDSFNPTLSQKISLRVPVKTPGTLVSSVVDRDGFVVRKLPSQRRTESGVATISWDGRDDSGNVVPDEAYSFKVDFAGTGGTDTYFPAASHGSVSEIRADFYDRANGILKYKLPAASRVHIQAGTAKVNPATKALEGPVLKTIVNRAPRPSGSVIEHWMGFDESGTIYVPQLPNFIVGIAATSLPENSVITIGNSAKTFVEHASDRRGVSLIEHGSPSHHHAGLQALDDSSPGLNVKPTNAMWSEKEKSWSTSEKLMTLRVSLAGKTAPYFAKQPGTVAVFIDGKFVHKQTPDGATIVLNIPVQPGRYIHTMAVNWVSEFGPVAVNSFRFRTAPKSKPRTKS